jgi:hypothetical protein
VGTWVRIRPAPQEARWPAAKRSGSDGDLGLFLPHGSDAQLALTDSNWETKETVASWLRKELKVLREAESEPGTAPVRRRGALSKTMISDVAIELLECIGGESLVCLFQELLDIDRHRKWSGPLGADRVVFNN